MNRCPSDIRSTSSAIASTARSTRSSLASDASAVDRGLGSRGVLSMRRACARATGKPIRAIAASATTVQSRMIECTV